MESVGFLNSRNIQVISYDKLGYKYSEHGETSFCSPPPELRPPQHKDHFSMPCSKHQHEDSALMYKSANAF